jgi:hypothetical protein
MFKCIQLCDFLNHLFDQEALIPKAAIILQALLEACSPRLSRIAEKMPGCPETNYKTIQRFLARVDLKAALLRFFQEEAEFVIGDPTEMPRPQAKKTAYVGALSDGQSLGYWLLVLATPFRGRAIPFHFILYSSKTIGAQATSRNQEHFRAFAQIKAWLGERPLVLDREFSYLELLQNLVIEQLHFVIRLKVGLPQVSLMDAQGQPLKLAPPQPHQTQVYRQVWYKGVVPVNVIGLWRAGFQTPLWVMTDLEPEKGLEIYLQRMKIEESFRDCKDLLGLEQAMNKQQAHLEQMIALSLLAYVVGLFLGEALRDVSYGNVAPSELSYQALLAPPQEKTVSAKWKHYSGLFVLLKQKLRISEEIAAQLQQPVAQALVCLVLGNVRSFV